MRQLSADMEQILNILIGKPESRRHQATHFHELGYNIVDYLIKDINGNHGNPREKGFIPAVCGEERLWYFPLEHPVKKYFVVKEVRIEEPGKESVVYVPA